MEAARAGWSQSWILSILINWQNKERERERERERDSNGRKIMVPAILQTNMRLMYKVQPNHVKINSSLCGLSWDKKLVFKF